MSHWGYVGWTMSEVTIRELRNHGGAVVDRVSRGEQVTVTRAGRPVAELRPISKAPLPAELLVRRRRRLPIVDTDSLRGDIDALLDGSL